MRELPAGAEWATAPLLHPDNIGRYVWYVFNSNSQWAQPLPIVKIGRTNIHLDGNAAKPYSVRVQPNGHTAYGTDSGGYSQSAHTEQWRIEREERREILYRTSRVNWGTLPLDALRQIDAILQEHSPTRSPWGDITGGTSPGHRGSR